MTRETESGRPGFQAIRPGDARDIYMMKNEYVGSGGRYLVPSTDYPEPSDLRIASSAAALPALRPKTAPEVRPLPPG